MVDLVDEKETIGMVKTNYLAFKYLTYSRKNLGFALVCCWLSVGKCLKSYRKKMAYYRQAARSVVHKMLKLLYPKCAVRKLFLNA